MLDGETHKWRPAPRMPFDAELVMLCAHSMMDAFGRGPFSKKEKLGKLLRFFRVANRPPLQEPFSWRQFAPGGSPMLVSRDELTKMKKSEHYVGA